MVNSYNKIYGLHKHHPPILTADKIELVWDSFCKYVNDYISGGKISLLVAYHGGSCDMEWCYRIKQDPNTILTFPNKVKYFMNPLQIKKKYSGFLVSPRKSQL